MMKAACGIDLGTSNSVLVAIVKEEPYKIIKSAQGETLHPSAIYYPPNSKEPIVVGRAAYARLQSANAGNVILQPKRALGISTKTLKEKGLLGAFNAKVVLPKGQRISKVKFELEIDGQKTEKPVEHVIQDMLTFFGNLVVTQIGPEVCFVLSRPQFWNCDQTSTYKKAAEEALGESKIVDIITEPMGGQYAYSALKPAKAKTMLIVDLGAGTYDLSMLRERSPGNYVGVTTGGDDLLGGSNVELEFLRVLEKELKNDPSFKQTAFDKQKIKLLSQLKEMKHELSMVPSATLNIFGVTESPEGFSFEIDQGKKLEILSEPYYKVIQKRTEEMFERKTVNGKLSATDLMKQVQIIFPIGGPQRDSYVIDNIIQPMFPNAQIVGRPGAEGSLNPDEVVAVGNAFWCAARMGTEAAKKVGLPPPIHVNVLSRALGVEGVTRENGKLKSHFCQVIPPNTPLPTCHEKQGFSTSVKNQEFIRISVFQGEGILTGDPGMENLGHFSIPMETPNEVDGPMINVEMEVTPDNILIVRAGEEGKMQEQTFDAIH